MLSAHPLIVIITVSLIIRSILSLFFTYSYDVTFWGTVFENIQTGNGLYDLPGYYYTPIWGYFIAAIGTIMNVVFGIGSFGTMGPELIPTEGVTWQYYQDLVSSVEFSISFKFVFTLVDLAISYILFKMVMDRTGNKKKASIAFGMWFLCPIVIYTSCVQVMFDSISILLILMAVYMLMKKWYFIAGFAFCMAVFTKYFPAYLFFILIAYIIAHNNRNIRTSAIDIGMASMGAVIALIIIYLPCIMDGTVLDTFGFVFNRVDGIGDTSSDTVSSILSNGYAIVLLLQPIIFALELYIAYRLAKYRGDDLDGKFIHYLVLSTACIFLWTPTPTYLLIIIPFLILHILWSDRHYIPSYILLATIPVLYSISMHSFSLLFQISIIQGIISPDLILNGIFWMDSQIMGISHQDLLNLILGAMETISIYSIFLIFLKRRSMDEAF